MDSSLISRCAANWDIIIHVFFTQSRPVDGLLCAWSWKATRMAFVSYISSSLFKPFLPLINLSLVHGATSILSQHPTVKFQRVRFLCPKNVHYSMFFDGLILQWSVCLSALVATYQLKAQCGTVRGPSLEQAMYYNNYKCKICIAQINTCKEHDHST